MFVDESMNRAKNWKEFKRSASRRMENSNAYRSVSRESPRSGLFKKKKLFKETNPSGSQLGTRPLI